MKTFEEYQAAASQVPLSLRNDRDRIQIPVLGLQEEAGKIGSVLAKAFASGKFSLTKEQSKEVKDRLSDTLWVRSHSLQRNRHRDAGCSRTQHHAIKNESQRA